MGREFATPLDWTDVHFRTTPDGRDIQRLDGASHECAVAAGEAPQDLVFLMHFTLIGGRKNR